MVWRLGSGLLETPQLPSCIGVVPLGLELGVFNRSPGSFRARWETLFVKGDTCVGSCGLQFPHQMHQIALDTYVLYIVQVSSIQEKGQVPGCSHSGDGWLEVDIRVDSSWP